MVCHGLCSFGLLYYVFCSSLTTRLSKVGRLEAVSPPIGKTLASDTLERSIGTLNVIEPISSAVVPAKVKLISVAL